MMWIVVTIEKDDDGHPSWKIVGSTANQDEVNDICSTIDHPIHLVFTVDEKTPVRQYGGRIRMSSWKPREPKESTRQQTEFWWHE